MRSHPDVAFAGPDALLERRGRRPRALRPRRRRSPSSRPRDSRLRIVCGGANNQLATPAAAQVLADAGVLYVPDFVVNAGGVIQVADEARGYNEARARHAATRIFDTTLAVLRHAEAAGVLPEAAAEQLAERRIAGVGRLRGLWPPGSPA